VKVEGRREAATVPPQIPPGQRIPLPPPLWQHDEDERQVVLDSALVRLPELAPSYAVIAHHDQCRAIQQALARHVLDEVVVRVIAQLGIGEVIVGETGLPDETEVRIRGELRGRFASVVQQAVERLSPTDAEIGVQFVRVTDVVLGTDAVRSQVVIRRLFPKARLQVIERRHAAGVLAEYRAVTGGAELLPQKRAIVERLVVVLPAQVAQFVLIQTGQHRDEIGVRVVGDLGVAQHLDGAEDLKRLHGFRHHPVEVHPGDRVKSNNENTQAIVDRVRLRSLASLLYSRLAW